MKINIKRFLFYVLLGLFAQVSFGQTIFQGTFIIDPYYGFPNFGKFVISPSNVGESEYKVLGVGPWGVRMEYLIDDKFGITLDGIHNSAGFSLKNIPDFTLDDEGNLVSNEEEYRYKFMMNRLRFQVGLNYHFDFTEPMLDGYIGFAAGTNNRTWSLTSNEPNFENYDELKIIKDIFDFFRIPVSARLRFGGRYYFTDNFGVNLEFGLGGPVISTGLSIKI